MAISWPYITFLPIHLFLPFSSLLQPVVTGYFFSFKIEVATCQSPKMVSRFHESQSTKTFKSFTGLTLYIDMIAKKQEVKEGVIVANSVPLID